MPQVCGLPRPNPIRDRSTTRRHLDRRPPHRTRPNRHAALHRRLVRSHSRELSSWSRSHPRAGRAQTPCPRNASLMRHAPSAQAQIDVGRQDDVRIVGGCGGVSNPARCSGCQRHVKTDPLSAGGFQGWSQHFRESGGRVVIVSSGQEGAGASPAVGQTSEVHGASRTRAEHRRRRPRGRRVTHRGKELGERLQDVPLRSGGGVRGRRWIGSRCARSAPGSCPRTSGSRSPICTAPAWACVRSLAGSAGRRRRSHASCAATRARRRAIARSRRTAGRPLGGPVTIAVGSTPTSSCDR